MLGALALTIAQALLIAILLVQRARRAQAERTLMERLEFERVFSELSASFVNLPVEEIDETIDSHLRKVAKVTGVDGCSLFEFSSNYEEALISRRYDSTGSLAPFSVVKFEQFPWYLNELRSGAVVKLCDISADLPEEAVAERKAARDVGIKSVLTVPITISQTVTSAISVFTAQCYRDWPAELATRLRLVGEIFVQAMLRKRTEEALRESQSRVSGVVNSAMDAIIMVDANQRVVLFNAAAEKMFRCTADETIGQRLERLIPARFWVDHSAHMSEFGETGVTTRAMARARAVSGLRSDGEEFPIEASISQIETGGQKLVTVIMRDITERRTAEEALRTALTEVSQLKDQLQQENIYLRDEIRLEHNFQEIIGESDEIKYTLYKIEQVAPTDSAVLILGETGTGKELVARAIHGAGPRKHRPLVKINCAALPASLVESELFGHERGAFTGAHARKLGRFEIADGATLFLDEVGELQLDLQAKLLRVLQDGEFERVGGSNTIKADVRIIAASNRDLKAMTEKGLFREDLWYRLSVFPITVPPLRQRDGDIPLLVNHFVETFNRKLGRNITSISLATLKTLQRYSWRGNVRELANVIERAVINSQGPALQLADKLEDENYPADTTENSTGRLIEVERNHILKVLTSTGWKIEGRQGAATILGMKSSTLRTRLAKLGIHRPSKS